MQHTSDIRKLVRPGVRDLSAYNAKEIPCRVKLDANESPYSAFSNQLSAFSNKKIFKTLNRYPDPEAKGLKSALSKNLKIRPENILVGNGSDELIYYLITTFGGPILYPVPTFSMYGIIAKALGEKDIAIPLDGEFDIDMERTMSAVKRERPKLIFLSSPNNPTGNCFSTERILKIIEITSLVSRHPSLVVVDEAYQPFSSEKGFLPLLGDYTNLVIMRTLSKIGFAGLRVGFLIADPIIINEVNKVRLPFNLNSYSQSIAAAALRNRKETALNIKLIVSERERLFNELEKIKGIIPYPSEANFILLRVKNADKIYKGLLKKGVLVRNMKGIADGCLRVTVGTKKENDIFLKTVRKVLG
ncbi:MAG: histidinol-phosphate transaminase [Nitrospirae bacterium]|nr:histidinol-phosphate transaminase [Nitrospirota bacterium]